MFALVVIVLFWFAGNMAVAEGSPPDRELNVAIVR